MGLQQKMRADVISIRRAQIGRQVDDEQAEIKRIYMDDMPISEFDSHYSSQAWIAMEEWAKRGYYPVVTIKQVLKGFFRPKWVNQGETTVRILSQYLRIPEDWMTNPFLGERETFNLSDVEDPFLEDHVFPYILADGYQIQRYVMEARQSRWISYLITK